MIQTAHCECMQVFGALCTTLATSALLLRSNTNLDSGRRELNCWYCCYGEIPP